MTTIEVCTNFNLFSNHEIQVLLDMWKFTELRELYKKGGWKESHFIVRSPSNSKNSTYSVNSNTIGRPM